VANILLLHKEYKEFTNMNNPGTGTIN